MILPISHENMESRRWPWLTGGLIVVNVVALIVLTIAMDRHERVAMAAWTDVHAFERAHPYLLRCGAAKHGHEEADEAGPRGDRPPEDLSGFAELMPRERTPGRAAKALPVGPPAELQEAEQKVLDASCEDLAATLEASPERQYGFVAARPWSIGLLTHAFLHVGWLHLIGNMWFLWLCGCNLEDRWGRPVFGAFFGAAALAGAFGQYVMDTSSAVPMVGASGAVSGAMGAFLIAFASTKIRFFWMMMMRWGTFTAPAYVMLPLWLLSEAASGLLPEDGVGHWAHVSGFVFGAAVALVLRRSGIEKKLDDAVEDAVTTRQDARILRAGDLIDAKAYAEAFSVLEAFARENPDSIDAQLELLRAAKGAGDGAREAAAYDKLLELYLRMDALDTALSLFEEAEGVVGLARIRPALRLRMADALTEKHALARAARSYASLHAGGIDDIVSVRAAVGHARVSISLGAIDDARRLLEAARASPIHGGALDQTIHDELSRIAAR